MIIRETGGVRKLRWGIEGRGKRGGARIIYYDYNSDFPLFALTAYAKNEREDLSQADRNSFSASRRSSAATIDPYRTHPATMGFDA